MTAIQTKYLNFIKDKFKKDKVSPTLKEIACNFNVSIPTVQQQINRLIMLGEIGKTPNVKNGIYLITDKGKFWQSKYEEILEILKSI